MSGKRRRSDRRTKQPPAGGTSRGAGQRSVPAVGGKQANRPARAKIERRYVAIAGLIGVVAVALAVVVMRTGPAGAGNGTSIVFPPWPDDPVPERVAFDDFVGADACAECHRPEHDAWSSSTHGRAGGEPGEARLLRAFDGRPIRFRDATVTPRIVAGEFVFVVAQEGRDEQVLRVDGVIGEGHMIGGGTQGFVTHHDDGTWRFLPFELIRDEDVWFCNTDTRQGEGWLPITEDMALADCGDWPPVRVLGETPRFGNCQACHGSQITVEPAPGRPHETRFTSLEVNCESCHGPARRHVELARAGRTAEGPDIGLRPLATLSVDESLEVCFRCHALKDALSPGDMPGRPLEEHYSLRLPLLGESPVFADGRSRTFGYQQGHLYSDCYRSGSMTCVDCHDPHGQGYRDVHGRPLVGRFDDRQCTACHASKAIEPETHTRHAPGSAGSQCVACHMPFLQQPEVGTALRYARSDHTIPIPRPAFDAQLGVEVACQLCHVDRSVEGLQADVERLWGEPKPLPPPVAALAVADTAATRLPNDTRPVTTAAAARALDAQDLIGIARDTVGQHAMARFAAIGQLATYELPRVGRLDDAIAQGLRELALDPDDDIAAAALAALHYALGDDTGVRRFIVDTTRELGERERRVRLRWAVILGYLGDLHREANEPFPAIATYRKALEARPGDAATLLSLGLALAAAGDYTAAETAYAESLERDPTRSLTWVNLGIARGARGDVAGAAVAYRNAIDADAADPLPHFNLGNILLRSGDASQAVEHYQRAAALDPSLAPAHFNLGRAHIAREDLEAARDAIERGLEFEPGNSEAAQALRDIEQMLGTRP